MGKNHIGLDLEGNILIDGNLIIKGDIKIDGDLTLEGKLATKEIATEKLFLGQETAGKSVLHM
ncbi:hypothetical protein IIB79_10635, partial [candidate division KSB1 bacterium]|nr:hypothetical protein [candidate division KSB1 bacterium]